MPLTQVSLRKGKSVEYRQALMEQIYLAMRENIEIPEADRFATVTELDNENFNNSGNYAGIERSDDVIFVQITLNADRTAEKKRHVTQASPNVLLLIFASEWKMLLSILSKWRKRTGPLAMAWLNIPDGKTARQESMSQKIVEKTVLPI